MREAEIPWDRRARIALALLVAAMLASLPWTVHPWYEAAGDTNDAAMYIACGRALLAGHGYSYLGEPFTLRPPGVSAIVAAVFALRGTDFWALNLVTSSFGVAAVALLFVYARERIGTAVSFVLCGAVWLDSEFQRLCNQTMSDVPGVALILACLLLERWAARRPSIARDCLLGAAIGVSTYMRSVAILLVPAILCARAWERLRGKRELSWSRWALTMLLPLTLVAVAVKLPWDLRSERLAPAQAVDQTKLYSYSTGILHADPGDPASPRKSLAEIVAPVPQHIAQIGAALGSGLQSSDSAACAVLGWLALACVAWRAWRQRSAGDLFVLGNVVVLAVYFDFGQRLVLPILLLALPAAADVVICALARLARPRVTQTALIGAFALIGVLGFDPRRGWDEIRTTHEQFVELAAQVERELPADARLGALRGWHFSVYLDRPVYSLRHSIRRAELRGETADQGIEHALAERKIDFVLLAPSLSDDRDVRRYFGRLHIQPTTIADALLYDARH